jgi:hypothetical protein
VTQFAGEEAGQPQVRELIGDVPDNIGNLLIAIGDILLLNCTAPFCDARYPLNS